MDNSCSEMNATSSLEPRHVHTDTCVCAKGSSYKTIQEKLKTNREDHPVTSTYRVELVRSRFKPHKGRKPAVYETHCAVDVLASMYLDRKQRKHLSFLETLTNPSKSQLREEKKMLLNLPYFNHKRHFPGRMTTSMLKDMF
uniref:Uncharacterized protein n=1 Tax=Timema poppense TaxID=170557 RepID=A0A7R9D6G5_TIMPO|nr:unnamed protein product [Timema poppensis]